MRKQNQITNPIALLDDNGELIEPGYATKQLWNYDKNKIKAGFHRIKEWDYYYILNNDFGITITLSDLGYAGLFAICWLDFKTKTFNQSDAIKLLPMGRTGFPSSSDNGIIKFSNKKMSISVETKNNKRTIKLKCPDFTLNSSSKKGLYGEIILTEESDADSMVIATSWKKKPSAFYYNQKINCMSADGKITIGENEYTFTKKSSFAGLDWGRGNWTYINRWYWSSASGLLNDKKFGWNLGYGFSDRSPATENMIFYDGVAHKLEDVTFHIDKSNYMKPWKFSSSDGRFEMQFSPIIDRNSKFNLLIIKSLQHQVFGHFSGYVILDSGEKLEIKNFLGFAEDVYNRW